MIAFETVSDRLARGEALSPAEAEAILGTPDLIAVGMLGDQVRRQMHGARTTFVRVFELHVDAPPKQVPSSFQAGEVRIVGKPATADAAVAAVRAAADLQCGVAVLGFSLADLWTTAASPGDFDRLCGSLVRAGLAGISDVPLDRMEDAALPVEAARGAGLRVERLTMETFGEEERLDILARARDLQDAVGGFRAFAPLARTVPTVLPTTGYDDVKQVALARMIATNVPSIQVDWRLYGPKLAQVALTMGADDVDGVEGVDDGALGTRRSPLAEILGNIRAAGLEPLERDGLFQVRG